LDSFDRHAHVTLQDTRDDSAKRTGSAGSCDTEPARRGSSTTEEVGGNIFYFVRIGVQRLNCC
jgi:hypothetical protein